MKNDSSAMTGRNGGPAYFRSSEDPRQNAEAQLWAEGEFPVGVDEAPDEASRRDFLKLMSASMALGGVGLTGCRRPEEHIYPFAKQPDDYIHGVAQYFASAMPTRGGGIPVVVKSHEGRPVKIEGNAEHPDSNGGTDAFVQAAILSLYDPDRARRFTRNKGDAKAEEVMDLVGATGIKFGATQGKGLAILAEQTSSPSRARLVAGLQQKFPQAIWSTYEPVDFSIHRKAASAVVGQNVEPYFKIDQAKRIVSLDCDFLGTEEDSHRHIRGFAAGRKIAGPDKAKSNRLISRLYVVEPLMSQTGANADHRLRLASSQVVQLAARLAMEVLTKAGFNGGRDLMSELARLSQGFKGNSQWASECALDLVANKGQSLVMAGHRQPLVVHLIVNTINEALEAYGKTVSLNPVQPEGAKSIKQLAAELNAGHIDTLIVLGGNPVYSAPTDLDWKTTQRKARTVIRLGLSEDETYEVSDYSIPQAHWLESWGDVRTTDGTLAPVQPLIAPLWNGVTELEVLARLLGEAAYKPHDVVQETFRTIAGADPLSQKWKKFLHDGYLAGSQYQPVNSKFNLGPVVDAIAKITLQALPSSQQLEVIFHRDYRVDDGRYSNNGWLQEMPDPVTKLVWDNAVLISRVTAGQIGVTNEEVVTVSLGGRTVTAPVWVQPGQAEGTIGIALGFGRERAGRIGTFDGKPVGFNATLIRSSEAMDVAQGATITGSGRTHKFACTQEHWGIHGRPIVREANLEQYFKKPDFAHHMDLEAHMDHVPKGEDGKPKKIYEHPYESKNKILKSDVHQWGMSIDLNSCVGCSACMIACQSENNVPIVGKRQVTAGREMHWLRIDRYYAGEPAKSMKVPTTAHDEDQWKHDWIDDVQVVNQPMMCQHCESAPCESVCPVNATVHDTEGVNVMAYNRCVGTRYCSNNCAWKVRRFNWFDYTKRPLEKIYNNIGLKDLLTLNFFAERPQDEIDILAMAKNPDVSVRMRGVMEKCTFCVQRVEQAKISQKVKARNSNDVQVKEGAVKSACQQACPAEAIVFGNLLDPESEVSQLKKQQRDYAVLGFLDTNPRLTYLAKVRNPNPSMPGTREYPFSLDEYRERNGDPFVEHSAQKGAH